MEDKLDIKILFIDDEEDVREVAQDIMKNDYGYTRFETSSSVEEAKKSFEHEHFDILIIDMRFNGEERGFELLELGDEKHQIASNMIIFTANDDVMDCRKAFKMGAWDYIPKNLTDSNPYEEIHKSIQEAVKHTDTWGNDKDTHWVNDNIDMLIEKYDGKYLAVMDGKIIASANTEEELKEIMKEQNSPSIMPLIFKVQ